MFSSLQALAEFSRAQSIGRENQPKVKTRSHILDAYRAQQRQAAVTIKGDEVKIPTSADANQSLGHERREFQTLTLLTQRVRHPESQNSNPAVTYLNGIIKL
jgi:hypothetical protein